MRTLDTVKDSETNETSDDDSDDGSGKNEC